MTSAAPAAPENGAITQGEMGGGEIAAGEAVAAFGRSGSELGAASDTCSGSDAGSNLGSGFGFTLDSGGESVRALVSLDISVASRSIVGGARLTRPDSGSDPASSSLSSTIATVPQV